MICLTCRVCHARCDFRVFFSLSYPAAECMLLAGSVPAANAALVPARCRWVGRVVPASDRQQVTLRLARPYSGVSPSSLSVRLFLDLRVRVSVQTLHHVLDGFRLINLFPYFLPLIRCNLAAGGVGGRYYPFLPLSSFQCSDTRAPRPRKVWKTVAELACGYGKNTHPQRALPWETVSMDTESRCCFADRSKKESAATDGACQKKGALRADLIEPDSHTQLGRKLEDRDHPHPQPESMSLLQLCGSPAAFSELNWN